MTLKVILKGHTRAMYKEADAAEAITPGHLVALNTTGGLIKLTLTAHTQVAVAIENHWVGGTLDTPYALNDRAAYQVLDTGAEFQALLAAAAAAVVVGDFLESAGNGTVRKTVTQANATMIARQAVDNSAGATQVRIRAEVI